MTFRKQRLGGKEEKVEKVIKGRFNRTIAAEKDQRKTEVMEKLKKPLLGKRDRDDKESKPDKKPSASKKGAPTKRPRF